MLCLLTFLSGCDDEEYPDADRESKIPAGAEKVTPATDLFPPILHSREFRAPVPMPYPINTAGGEDSPFITWDGNEFYFFFTPDVSVPAELQVIDEVTGVYKSVKTGGVWGSPTRVWLQDPGKLSLDGAHCLAGDTMWFVTAREGFTGLKIFTAQRSGGGWRDWKHIGDRLQNDFQMGEMHVMPDGTTIYFGSMRPGGAGDEDIWVTRKVGGEWQLPENVAAVNTAAGESRPFVTPDENEMWITRWYRGYPAIFRSRRVGGVWRSAVLILSQFAAEPTVDSAGNVYFAHHFFRDGVMIEADFYVAYRK